MNLTPEALYSVYYREAVLKTRGIVPRPIVDYSKMKAKPDWKWLVKASEMIANSNGHIDLELYIKTLVDFYKGFFPLERLCHISSLKIYRTRVDAENVSSDMEKIKRLISKNLIFIVDFCIENDILDFNGYLKEDIDLIPSMARHLSGGGVSVFLLALIPNIERTISAYPVDVQREYFVGFLKRKEDLRRMLLKEAALRGLSDNIDKAINKLISEKKLTKLTKATPT